MIHRESQLWEQWLKGLGGILNRLDEFGEDKIRMEFKDEETLLYCMERLQRIVHRSQGKPPLPCTHKPAWTLGKWDFAALSNTKPAE